MEPDAVDTAIVLYSGFHRSNHPLRDIHWLDVHFHPREVEVLAPTVMQLVHDFYLTHPRYDESLLEATDRASEAFTGLHPEIGPAAIEALRWCYAFDWK